MNKITLFLAAAGVVGLAWWLGYVEGRKDCPAHAAYLDRIDREATAWVESLDLSPDPEEEACMAILDASRDALWRIELENQEVQDEASPHKR